MITFAAVNLNVMATIKRYLSTKVVNDVAEVFLRVSVARGKVWKFASGVFIDPARLRPDGSVVYPRANRVEAAVLHEVERRLGDLEQAVFGLLLKADPSTLERGDVAELIDRHNHPEKYVEVAAGPRSFFGLFDEFVRSRDISKSRTDCYLSLGRCLHRFEMHRRATGDSGFELDVDLVSADDLSGFERFYRDEWRLYDEFPEIYTEYPAELRLHHRTHRPMRRGTNVTVNVMGRLRAFFNWLYAQGLTQNRPFDRYGGCGSERYGTPYYLTLEERDHIADFDLSRRPGLAVQRDIFIFQCLVGCRVSDLRRLQASNVVRGAVEYVATKTRRERGEVVRVPLGARARALVEKYAGSEDGRLFPFISDQRYNDAIKEICRLCGVDRVVTVIDPATGLDERRPICELASSHMARRTFIGNLYRRVKDPNLVSSLSGHKEGSRAFARYREIDDDLKREIIDLIE